MPRDSDEENKPFGVATFNGRSRLMGAHGPVVVDELDPQVFQPRNGFLYGSGQRIRADEMDMAVLNLGAGTVPMQGQHLQMRNHGSFTVPVVNLEYDANSIPATAVRPDLQGGQLHLGRGSSNYVQGDANHPQTTREISGFQHFNEIHAINPYQFDPLLSAPLLAPGGRMYVSGQNSNPFATQRDLEPLKNKQLSKMAVEFEKRVGTITSDPETVGLRLTHRTASGQLTPLHQTMGQQHLSQSHGGKVLDTSRSHTSTFIKMDTPRDKGSK